jgi:mannonate dehydratase
VPRCIFGNFDGYRRALDIADSPNVGICLCVGCWLEGGPLMGKDILEAVNHFGKRRKIFKVHFRNVSAPLPHFVETFPDNGYMDMYQVMKALRQVDFDGVLIPDHIPLMANDRRVGMAYTVGYIKALMERADEEIPTS